MIRSQIGGTIVEFGAVLMLAGPLLITLLFAGMEVCHVFAVKSALDTSARNGARLLVVAYNNGDPSIVTGTTVSNANSQTYCDNHIQIPNYVVTGNNQWTVSWTPTTNPVSVTVTCSYPMSGTASLPRVADPVFNIGGGSNLQGQFTMPVQ